MFFDCSKAVAAGIMARRNSLEIALQKAIDWYVGNGYACTGPGETDN
jgi:NOL1/NOP2/fmu family ribosome biogenesis protein